MAEILVQNAVRGVRPKVREVACQAGRTFCGFGCFTALWAWDASRPGRGAVEAGEPPRPFAKCLVLALMAGTVGSLVVDGVVEGGLRRDARGFLVGAGLRGAGVTGVTIAVQVSLAAWGLRRLDER